MKERITFEDWTIKGQDKKRKVITVRNDKGVLISHTPKKGSGIRTVNDAYNKYREDNTLSISTAKLSRKNPKVEKDIKTLSFKGKDKNLKIGVSRAVFKNATRIGNNTVSIRTKRAIRNQNHRQYVATVKWGDSEVESVGFSDMNGTKKQAFKRAMSDGIKRGLLPAKSGEIKLSFTSDKDGFAYTVDSKNKKIKSEIVYFTYDYSVQTYINSTKQF